MKKILIMMTILLLLRVEIVTASQGIWPDGNYEIAVTMSGGSGKASIESPAQLNVQNGTATARIIFSSPNYDYMRMGGQTYYPVNTEGNSTFEIPVAVFDAPMEVVADTVAMSTPHEITYTLFFDSSSVSGGGMADGQITADNIFAAAGYLAGAAVAVILIVCVIIYMRGRKTKDES